MLDAWQVYMYRLRSFIAECNGFCGYKMMGARHLKEFSKVEDKYLTLGLVGTTCDPELCRLLSLKYFGE